MMSACEHCEILLSTWHDGELDHGGQFEMLEHLVRCAGCREYYLGARGLAGLVAAVRTPVAAEVPSPELWSRIELSARPEKSSHLPAARAWSRWFPAPAWGAAAVAAILLVLFNTPWEKPRIAPVPNLSFTEIRLGENPEGMDEERFVELTKKVLGADRKYRMAFYEIMKQVVEDTHGDEPSSDLLLKQGEKREGAEAPESVGGPS